MYFADHAAPHFHAVYGGAEVVIAIGSREVIRGALAPRALALVREWAAIHEAELLANWQALQVPDTPRRIDPLP